MRLPGTSSRRREAATSFHSSRTRGSICFTRSHGASARPTACGFAEEFYFESVLDFWRVIQIAQWPPASFGRSLTLHPTAATRRRETISWMRLEKWFSGGRRRERYGLSRSSQQLPWKEFVGHRAALRADLPRFPIASRAGYRNFLPSNHPRAMKPNDHRGALRPSSSGKPQRFRSRRHACERTAVDGSFCPGGRILTEQ